MTGLVNTAIAAGSDVKIVEAGPSCFTVVSVSKSGNEFGYLRKDDGSVLRDCRTRGQTGCPTDGQWAG
jgi:hypothetical protein